MTDKSSSPSATGESLRDILFAFANEEYTSFEAMKKIDALYAVSEIRPIGADTLAKAEETITMRNDPEADAMTFWRARALYLAEQIVRAQSLPSATRENFIPVGRLNRSMNGEVRFLQDVFMIPLPVHGTLQVYRKEGEDAT